MHRSKLIWLFALGVLFLGSPVPASESGYGPVEEVLECMAGNVPDTATVQEIELHSQDMQAEDLPGSIRILRATVYTKRFPDNRLRVLAYFHDPFHVRGTRVLIVEKQPLNESYFYAPVFGKVKKLTARSVSSSLHGTDFSYDDLERVYGMFRVNRFRRLADGEAHGAPVYVLSTESPPGEQSRYRRILTSVDKRTCVVTKMELYEKGDRLRKTFTVVPESIRQVNGHWVPHEMVMKDERATTDTRLYVRAVQVNVELPERYFDIGNLHEFEPE